MTTRNILTNYQLYQQLIPFVSETAFNEKTQTLHVQGGIWKFKLNSFVRFKQKSEHWIRFKIIKGHFRGLVGDLYFEDYKEDQTWVYISGKEGIFSPGIPVGEVKIVNNIIEVLLFSDLSQITFVNINLGGSNKDK